MSIIYIHIYIYIYIYTYIYIYVDPFIVDYIANVGWLYPFCPVWLIGIPLMNYDNLYPDEPLKTPLSPTPSHEILAGC